MILLPAIDLLEGRAVRLYKGRRAEATDYGDPVTLARGFASRGGQWLHLVDLSGAFGETETHHRVIPQIIRAFDGPVEIGGGIRTLADISRRIEEWGADRVILGTAAVTQPALVEAACRRYPGRIACGIDAQDGRVALRGWVEESALTAQALAIRVKALGVETVIYTDIARDGTLAGPNVAATAQLIQTTGLQVIGSGGVDSLESLRALKAAGCAGAITGKALYAGAFTLEAALETVK